MPTPVTNRGYQRSARVLQRLVTAPASTDLQQLAHQEALSPWHLQRSFHRWVGLSPARFAEFISVAEAQGLLAASRSVLDVSLELNLSSPSRLHDRFITFTGLTPGEWAADAANTTINFGVGDTPLGQALLGWTKRGICQLDFIDDVKAATDVMQRLYPRATLQRDDRTAQQMLTRAFTGRITEPLALCVRGTRFQIAVWKALLDIPSGAVSTYRAIAETVGSPRGQQAAGQAIGANPISVLIPCHRVIASSGALTGYHWGLARKTALLARELIQTGVSHDA